MDKNLIDKMIMGRKCEYITKEHLQYAFDAIDSNNKSMPLRFYPNEMYHGDTQQLDAWDRYENERFEEQIYGCYDFWNRLLCLAMRIRKLEKCVL
ncbi:MAG: hypothetical protein Gaeavirus11_16 [Gaeavirus sp.]|uniref:Uncharacterized protein n=1 Tax=Gaeavirus sp. TaxID=2487767 RepID=A0A3G4ZYX1_9VIRU|nr:MAG: hypothetical protein Gaeavirus11_16 [Gaeavirus sp.]